MRFLTDKSAYWARAVLVVDGVCPNCKGKLRPPGEGCYYPDHSRCLACRRCWKANGTARSCTRLQ